MSGHEDGGTPSSPREIGIGTDETSASSSSTGTTSMPPTSNNASSVANGTNSPEPVSVNGNPGLPRKPAIGLISHHVCEKFKGSVDQDIQEWFGTFEMATSACGWNDVQRGTYLGLYLTGSAHRVWRSTCPKGDYQTARTTLLKAFDKSKTADAALLRFKEYAWDGKITLSEYTANLSQALQDYSALLPDDSKIPPAVLETLLIDRVCETATGSAKAEMRRHRPKTFREACEVLDAYSEDVTANATSRTQQVNAVTSPSPERVDSENISAVLTKEFERLTTAMTNALTHVVRPAQAGQQAPVQHAGNRGKGNGGRFQQQRRGGCGICGGSHRTPTCPFRKYDTGCMICGKDDHMARNCPDHPSRRPMASLVQRQGN
ncbi:hypothetical protein Pmar_PMAR027404 [Perkinsus marinus ATCC 50983]|uniref:CCHC-type domain-containing protein n=1 Tax=Perkinsus marinus (strain ATCC 50983 / TXsc) TaxID=423536 RepID=C5KSH2_PERM5|nr:hypothetical protein Pmar_PMAR027404 [Perkinsus marinus ATCC 50983]EER12586.1 hypothetical protein Pmar_PMAR027404 [Perkinsus marinus ATCC 50983]|eukprot:XP_002780791.1 hypothetical protein Pmar_PMAR027404 [Perkinsus marinus ATCC 50983]